DLDCVRVPRAVVTCVAGEPTACSELLVATTIMFTGFDLWDDAMDGDLPETWTALGPQEIALTAAALICGVGPIALGSLAIPPHTMMLMQHATARAFVSMAAGQQLDVRQYTDGAPSADSVLASIRGKSGAAFGMYAELAALFAGADAAQ